MTAGSCATWARESGQVRKEAALSGCRGCRRRARLEPQITDTPGDLVSENGRTVHNFDRTQLSPVCGDNCVRLIDQPLAHLADRHPPGDQREADEEGEAEDVRPF